MSITERIANLPLQWVAVIVIVLWVARWFLRKQPHAVAKTAAEYCEAIAVAGALVFFLIRPFIVQAFFIPSESMVPTLLIDDHILVNKFVYRVGEPKRGDIVVFKAPKAASPIESDFIKRVIGVPGDIVKIKPGRVMVGDTSYSHADLAVQLSEFGDTSEPPRIKLINGRVLVDGKAVSAQKVAEAVGLPRAKVKVLSGVVIVNGKPLKEPYIAEDADESYPGWPGYYVNPSWVVTDKQHDRAIKVPKGKLFVLGDNRNYSKDSRYWGLLDRSRVLGKAMVNFWPLGRIGLVR